jgi:ribosomal protein S6--L-glutamate ligase
VSVASISPELSSLAIQAAKALGLIISGVDILETEKGPVVLEVNASPELMGIEAVSKVDVAASILAAVERSFGAT